jgi:hypothetical protein
MAWREPALQDLDLSAVKLGAPRGDHVEVSYAGGPLEFAIRPLQRDAELSIEIGVFDHAPSCCFAVRLAVSKEIADAMRDLEAAVGSSNSCVDGERIRVVVSPWTDFWSDDRNRGRPILHRAAKANAVVEFALLAGSSGTETQLHARHLLLNDG